MWLSSKFFRTVRPRRRLLLLVISCGIVIFTVGCFYYRFLYQPDDYVPKVVQNVWLPKKRSCQCKKVRATNEESANALPYCYENPVDETLIGKPFKCTSRQYLLNLNLHEIHPKTALVPSTQGLTFATAAKPEHLMNIRALIASIQNFYPKSSLIVYDLGPETETRVKRLRFALKNVAGVQVKDSLKERFPPWTMALDGITPILMADAIRHYGRVVWLRPQMSLASPTLQKQILSSCPENSPNRCDRAKHNIILLGKGKQYEEPAELGFFAHFPVTPDIRNKIRFHNSSAIYLERHPKSYELLRWLILCALDQNCWSCKDRRGTNIECLPFVLPLLLFHRTGNNEEFTLAAPGTVVAQPRPPNECRFWCQTLSIVSIIVAFCLLVCCACGIAVCMF